MISLLRAIYNELVKMNAQLVVNTGLIKDLLTLFRAQAKQEDR